MVRWSEACSERGVICSIGLISVRQEVSFASDLFLTQNAVLI
jgi:hypothetical protein